MDYPVVQYADDTIICIEDDIDKAINLKLLMYMFEMMYGPKVNFQKSEILTVGGDETVVNKYAEIFDCEVGSFPIQYIGMLSAMLN